MTTQRNGFSTITDAIAPWSNIRQLIRSGDEGKLVPVVIPKDNRNPAWVALLFLTLYLGGTAVLSTAPLSTVLWGASLLMLVLTALALWRGSIVEIEQGTTGIRSRYGAFTGTLAPGRHYLWWPWDKVEFVVDTTTEIPYNAPVAACPTAEDVPLKSIEFFLKFRIDNPVDFVRTIGAGNFDMVLSSAVQDALRQRARRVHTEQAHELRGSDVEDMQQALNRQLTKYGVRILGANIPDVQLPDQYQQHLATRERVSKELSAYEREWELTRKRRIDNLLMEIERAKKTRDAKLVEVKAARNQARRDVARRLEEQETEAQRAQWEIEARGRATLTEAQNEAKSRQRLGQAYRDNRAVLHYELARRRLEVGSRLAENAPRPIVVRGGGDQSALSTLLLSQLLPKFASQTLEEDRGGSSRTASRADDQDNRAEEAAQALDQGEKFARSLLDGENTGR
ncbi:SPFH domain-containing protein [Actinopolyspora mortivallis]|uniref:SPFH domain-containing protein n=1 Tax=Actinopolyspora mortivallis TaxID=33906 RepID=UPI00037AE3DB|nr:SPFH domain-containing protein [Actinopolyspora mortivallis]